MKKIKKRWLWAAVILVVLVLIAVWTAGRKQASGEEKSESSQETQEQETQTNEATTETQGETKSAEELAAEQAAAEEAARQEQEKSTFVTDYESAPLLSTTVIRYLSLEVGGADGEVRLNWMSPSSSAGQVSWQNAESGENQNVTAQCSASQTVPGYYVNKATVEGLEAGKTYTYQVGNDAGGWSPTYSYTVPEGDTSEGFTFLVTSDAEIGQDEKNEMQVTVDDWDKVLTRLTSYVPEAQFLVHTGDQVSKFGDAEEYAGFLDHLALYKIPLVPVTGNHDVANSDMIEELGYGGGPYFYEHFNVPNRSEEYGMSEYDKDGDYYFIRGNALFIVLNSLTAQATDIHEEYVPKVIAEHPDTKWRIIIQHYPAYSSVEKYQKNMDSWMRFSLGYICEDNDIDLVLTGHDSVYSRSAFTNRRCETYQDYDYTSGSTVVNPEGTMFVTCGTSSGSLYQAATPNEQLVFQGQPEEPMALRIDLSDTELHLRAYTVDNWTVYDEYTIRKE